MRINSVPALGRPNVKRQRSFSGDTETERRILGETSLPVPVQPVHTAQTVPFPDRYQPNSVFLAHLIATRDAALHAPHGWQAQPNAGISAYRATAASPRKRGTGHVLSIDF